MKYIIFDFDGTLADSTDVFIKAWNLFAPKYRYDPIDIEDVIATKHMSLSQRAREYHFPMHKLPLIMPKVYRYFKENVKDVKLFEGIKEMLNGLAAEGYQIVVLSSNAKENIELLLKQEGVVSVSEVLTSSRIFGKDTVLKKFMRQNQVTPDQILYVGDELRDIQACNKVNIPFMWVSWGIDGFDLVEKENPKFVAHKPEEISEILIGK
ncbi:HAD hydrolase-like protein [Ureibacillus manganicus]|uniref:HAD family hydrolase n=1 Tax=Ureibacillus manganicus DSM 26584 TaxID=1384049 RepID=A0A0A3I196_9BACL|nr:HAD hydrolase-like protein [Ureibacillus manganicus]KGR77255.1 HAD family hydrolase [Ureibacillus manganicus DSM 26584]